MESIALPPFTPTLWGISLGLFVVCSLLLVAWRGPAGASGFPAALVPFLIPVAVTAFAVLVISSIGSLLLTVGKTAAVPLALAFALGVLLVCSLLATRPEESSR